MAWTEAIYPHFQPYDPHAFQILPAPQQPTTILQQLPASMMPPGSAPSIRPGGHVKEVTSRLSAPLTDLVELMMIQNAQMHQVIMNNMTMSALRSFGYSETRRDLVIIQENEADSEIYHHYYQPAPYLSYPAWLLPPATQVQDINKPTSAPPRRHSAPIGSVGADFTPAAEYNGAAEGP